MPRPSMAQAFAPPLARPLGKSAAWAFSGNAVFTLSQAGIFALLAKLGSPATVGRYAMGLAIVTPIMLLTRLQLRAVLATDVQDEHSFSDYFGVRLCTNVLGLGIVALVVAVGGFRPETAAVILLLGLVKWIDGVSDLMFGLLQRSDRWDVISISTAVKGLLSLPLLGGVMWWTGSLPWGLAAMAGWFLVVLTLYEIPIARRLAAERGELFRPTLKPGVLWRVTRLALPLGLAATLVSVINSLPRYVVEAELGEQALGYFAAAAQLVIAGALPLQALGQAAVTRLALYARTDPAQFRRLFLLLLAAAAGLGAAGVIGAMAFGDWVLAVVYQPEYARYHDLFVWLAVGVGLSFISSVLGYTMTGLRLFRAQLPLYLAAGAACFAGLLWFVPTYGLLGSAYANVATWAVATVGGVVVLLHHRSATQRPCSEEKHRMSPLPDARTAS